MIPEKCMPFRVMLRESNFILGQGIVSVTFPVSSYIFII